MKIVTIDSDAQVVPLTVGHTWDEFFRGENLFSDDFMENREQPPVQERENWAD